MDAIATDTAPAAIGPYSQAVRSGDLLFVSGQLPIDPETGEFAPGGSVAQMRQCMANIAAIAEAAGTSMAKTVKTTILVTDLSNFADLNAAYGESFSAPFPARACYQVAALPRGAMVEVEAVIELS
ncbi:Rid family detoxifying hydrolase [Palleronia sp. LCG004]|uniref:Rid family detoxifying hydrolase n=1 Tax=Palleronia sp. LCG004 TaxID=3079304 RepID=UPI002942FE63|nr:Rid family detoxifying hydrolase [Palleronia sp. LCG004]WOI58323.1 Rid family detoxifying hydrolase [Palleronia sp. LCG004]